MAGARSGMAVQTQTLAKEMVIERTVILIFCPLLSGVGRSGLQCDLDKGIRRRYPLYIITIMAPLLPSRTFFRRVVPCSLLRTNCS